MATTPTKPSSYGCSETSTRVEELISKLTIHLAGACGQRYDQPLDLFYAVTHAYDDYARLPRLITSSQARNGFARVQDQDVVTQGVWLLREFAHYLHDLGTQPVTIPVASLVDGMRQALLACEDVTEKHLEFFRWPRTCDFVTTLENFILAHECFFHDSGRLPSVEVTFHIDAVTHAGQDLPVTIHLARNMLLINFVDLQNVITEGKSVEIFPTLDQVAACDSSGRRALYVEYETSLPAHIGWSGESQRLEGTWPASLAGEFGAERQDGFVMPLGIAAIVTNVFPGGFKLERVVRAAIPVLVKRRPDACGGSLQELKSPTAHECFDLSPLRNLFDNYLHHDLTEAGQAAHGYSFFDQSLPCTPIRVCHARTEHSALDSLIKQPSSSSTVTPSHSAPMPRKRREYFESPLGTKEIMKLLQTKATAGNLEMPLELNPLSMANLWDATAHSAESRDVKCWTSRDSPAKRSHWDVESNVNMTPAEVVSFPKMPKSAQRCRRPGRAPLVTTQPRASPRRQERNLRDPIPSLWTRSPRRAKAEKEYGTTIAPPTSNPIEKLGTALQCHVPLTPSPDTEQLEHDHRPRRDSAFDFEGGPDLTSQWELDSVMNDDLFNVNYTPQPRSIRKSTKRRRNALSSNMQGSEDSSEDFYALRLFRLQNWRQEPEKLSEMDVDLLQQEIQMNYEESFAKTLSEMGVAEKMEGHGKESLEQVTAELTSCEQVSLANEEPMAPRCDSAVCFAWPLPDTPPPYSVHEGTDPDMGLSESLGFLELLRQDEAVVQTEPAALKASTDEKCLKMVSGRETGWTIRWTVIMEDAEEVDACNLMAFGE
ncbi:hypothetical protein LTR95_009495 [Oleoguttula sp. CCFEE 5521]